VAAPSDLPPRLPISPAARNALIVAIVLIGAIGGVLWFTRTREAVSDMNAQLQKFREADEGGATLIEQSGQDAINSIKRLPSVTLPAGATDVHFARQGQLHALYWIRYSAPQADVDAALKTSCFALPLEANNDPGFEYATSADVIANLDWWTPRAEKESSGGRCNPTQDVTFRVAVDAPSAKTRTVYLEIATGQSLTLPTAEVTP
jgi:hypothetical protein